MYHRICTKNTQQVNSLDSIANDLESLANLFVARSIDRKQAREGIERLQKLRTELSLRSTTLAELLSVEGHRPLSLCQLEVGRTLQVIEKTEEAIWELASVKAYDFTDAFQGSKKAIALRKSFGPLFAIIPFNFPLILAMHKLAPAIALGLPFVCKPPLQNVGLFKVLHEIFLAAGITEHTFSFLFVENESISALLERIPFPILSFTGSKSVGLSLRQKFWNRRVLLELGGTAFAVLLNDYPEDRHSLAAKALARSAVNQGGQSCISLQHLFVPQRYFESIKKSIQTEFHAFVEHHNPSDIETVCGPLNSEAATEKVTHLLAEAATQGFESWSPQLIEDHTYPAHYFPPTLVLVPDFSEFLRKKPALLTEEVFGPVLCLHGVGDDISEVALVSYLNATDANIQGSVFTTEEKTAQKFFHELQVRTLLWNEVPSWRADEMPYGGYVKMEKAGGEGWHSGLVGNEGPRQTLEEYTIDRLFVFS
jgi:aldehyde dehydrogenase (NAD+)